MSTCAGVQQSARLRLQTERGKAQATDSLTESEQCLSCAGGIKIDGVGSRSVDWPTYVASWPLVPQDPVIFTGTVRSNLDPNGYHRLHFRSLERSPTSWFWRQQSRNAGMPRTWRFLKTTVSRDFSGCRSTRSRSAGVCIRKLGGDNKRSSTRQ
jgi:hypothetical protein